jgi:hypothetical protein
MPEGAWVANPGGLASAITPERSKSSSGSTIHFNSV